MKQALEASYGWVVVWAIFVCLALIFGLSGRAQSLVFFHSTKR